MTATDAGASMCLVNCCYGERLLLTGIYKTTNCKQQSKQLEIMLSLPV